MKIYIQERRIEPREEALDKFLEDFDVGIIDEQELIRIFDAIWRELTHSQSTSYQSTNNAAQQLPPFDSERVKAPFRFVDLNQQIVPPEPTVLSAFEQGVLHSRPLPDALCGAFDLTISFDGPVLIGDEGAVEGIVAPLKLGKTYVIPGATLRGLTRSVLEIAAFAKLTQTNLHRRYGIRDFSHPLFADGERNKTRAGWLRPRRDGDPEATGAIGSGYVLEPCDWWLVKIRDLQNDNRAPGHRHLSWLNSSLSARYDTMGMRVSRGREKQPIYDFCITNKFRIKTTGGSYPFLVPIGGDQNKGSFRTVEGVYVFSDKSPTVQGLSRDTLDKQEANPAKGDHKKTETVFSFRSAHNPIEIPKRVWENFHLNNCSPSRNAPKPSGNWKALKPTLDEGLRIPVFWVSDDAGGIADLGLVRVFKRAHHYAVDDVLRRTGDGCHLVDPDEATPDFVEALFGFVHEPEDRREDRTSQAPDHEHRHLKGRVSFGFARLNDNTPADVIAPVQTVMSAPKPSFGPFYLRDRIARRGPAGTDGKDWSDSRAELAGRKRYLPRSASVDDVRGYLEQNQGNRGERILSRLHFITARHGDGLKFTARVKVHNITKVELGGLLWALTLGGDVDKRHLIGRAKTAGAGQARIEIGSTGLLEGNDGSAAPNVTSLIATFEAHMNNVVPGWRQSAPIVEFLRSVSPFYGEQLQQDGKLGYIQLREFRTLRNHVRSTKTPERLLGLDK